LKDLGAFIKVLEFAKLLNCYQLEAVTSHKGLHCATPIAHDSCQMLIK